MKSGEFYSIPIKDVHMTREFFLVYHKNKFIYPALQETIRTCTEYVQEVIEQEQSSSRFILP